VTDQASSGGGTLKLGRNVEPPNDPTPKGTPYDLPLDLPWLIMRLGAAESGRATF
jgi:hypothetical protein